MGRAFNQLTGQRKEGDGARRNLPKFRNKREASSVSRTASGETRKNRQGSAVGRA